MAFYKALENIELKNSSTAFLPSPLRISFSLCSGIRMLPLLISIPLRIAPLIRLAKNDFIVFSLSSDSSRRQWFRRPGLPRSQGPYPGSSRNG